MGSLLQGWPHLQVSSVVAPPSGFHASGLAMSTGNQCGGSTLWVPCFRVGMSTGNQCGGSTLWVPCFRVGMSTGNQCGGSFLWVPCSRVGQVYRKPVWWLHPLGSLLQGWPCLQVTSVVAPPSGFHASGLAMSTGNQCGGSFLWVPYSRVGHVYR